MKSQGNKEMAMSVIDKVMVSHSSSQDFTEVDSIVTQYIEKCVGGRYKCTLCGKVEKKDLSHLKNHIETHLEGLSFPCQLCEKTFRSRNALRWYSNITYLLLCNIRTRFTFTSA